MADPGSSPAFDVAVVGAGPAGATLSRLLAAGGLRVVLLEAQRLPRHKPCGGGLTMRAMALLPPAAREAVRLQAPGAAVAWRGLELAVRSPRPAVGLVLRQEFDARLVELAREAGALVRDAAPVTGAKVARGAVELTAGRMDLRARWVACADGAAGRFGAGAAAAALGLVGTAPRVGALEAEVADPDARWGDRLRGDFDVVPGGYGWVFPKGGVLSVGVASWRPGVGGAALRAALDGYLRRLGLAGRPVLRRHGHPIPVGGRLPARRLASAWAVRVGDAAGLADPLFGEGISYALLSAHLAADALLAGDPGRYARALAARLEAPFRAAAALAAVFYRAPGPWFRTVRRWPRLGDIAYTLAVGGR